MYISYPIRTREKEWTFVFCYKNIMWCFFVFASAGFKSPTCLLSVIWCDQLGRAECLKRQVCKQPFLQVPHAVDVIPINSSFWSWATLDREQGNKAEAMKLAIRANGWLNGTSNCISRNFPNNSKQLFPIFFEFTTWTILNHLEDSEDQSAISSILFLQQPGRGTSNQLLQQLGQVGFDHGSTHWQLVGVKKVEDFWLPLWSLTVRLWQVTDSQ